MPRLENIDDGRTSIIVPDILLERLSSKCRADGCTQNEFFTRAILNQLEREGDFNVRLEMREKGYDV